MNIRTVENELKHLERKRLAIGNLQEEIDILSMRYGAIRAARTDGDGVTGGDGSGRELALIDNIARRDELSRDRDITAREVDKIDRALAQLSPRERRILDVMYIHKRYRGWELLCDELCVSRSALYREKDEALKHYGMILYSVVTL